MRFYENPRIQRRFKEIQTSLNTHVVHPPMPTNRSYTPLVVVNRGAVATAHTTKGMSLSRQKLVRFLVMVIIASTETRGSSEQRALNEFPNRLGDVNVSQLESGYSTASADPAVVGVVEDWIDSKWNWTGETLPAGWKKKKTDDGNEDFLEWALDNATAALIYKDAHALGRLWNATLAVRHG